MATLTVTLITIALFIGAGAWVFFMIKWILGRLGIWQWATYKRLSKRYKNEPFNNETLEWCLERMEKKWRYKDIRTILKYEKDKGEILYTYLALQKLPKEELKMLLERRSNNGRQKDIGTHKETRRTLPTFQN